METVRGQVTGDGDKNLLPIREAYEWKREVLLEEISWDIVSILLPIREAYEWKRHGM